ncbi:MAG TPA: hypothetical protein VJB70_01465 [Candidatus Paceibacterota bacterium]
MLKIIISFLGFAVGISVGYLLLSQNIFTADSNLERYHEPIFGSVSSFRPEKVFVTEGKVLSIDQKKQLIFVAEHGIPWDLKNAPGDKPPTIIFSYTDETIFGTRVRYFDNMGRMYFSETMREQIALPEIQQGETIESIFIPSKITESTFEMKAMVRIENQSNETQMSF